MAKWKVFVTRRLPSPGLELVAEECDASVYEGDRPIPREELLRRVRGVEGLLPLLTEAIDAELMEAAGPQLRVIANYAVGFNNIDVAEATRRGILVTNTPGVLTETTADLAWALLMATARRLVEADAYMRAGKYAGWSPTLFLGPDVYGKTLGIVGFGRIGEAMARRARGFGMTVLYHDVRRRSEAEEQQLGVVFREMDDLLAEADFVTLHVDLNERTHHLIGRPQLERMKPSAILINAARGPVVDEAALVEALRTGQIAGAGLDVFEREPEMAPGLADLPNTVLVPHIASGSLETRAKMAEIAATNLLEALRGHRPPNLVNPEAWGKE
ncbi:2-hydroxyacid dehydrogenase [Limnochorda pilosa]|uniref:Glyoxylate reductase n=1 Tax=Limnochorda pilosa TaxID=1555112 RepID=A0A0K2SG78_LIMPI|nr:D-glycerate dehydrogenase [Limnochorda pilosa]BAS26106.1 glyoxylate reductase [Limnochorda pilosa]